MDTIDRSYPISAGAKRSPAAAVEEDVGHGKSPAAQAALPIARRHVALRWLLHDIPYIAMLLLALVGVVLRLPVIYWVILTPVFGIISIAEGRSPFRHPDGTPGIRLQGCAGLVCAPARHLPALQQRRPGGDECQRDLARHDDPAGARHIRCRRAGSGLADLCSRRCPVPGSPRLGLARPVTPAVNRWHVRDHRARWCRLVGKPVAPGHYEPDCAPSTRRGEARPFYRNGDFFDGTRDRRNSWFASDLSPWRLRRRRRGTPGSWPLRWHNSPLHFSRPRPAFRTSCSSTRA